MTDNKCPIKSILAHAAPVLTVLLLGGILAMDKLRVDPSKAAPFLKRTAAAIEAVPKMSGDWHVQREFELAPDVIKLLDVNAYLNRSYTNIRTGQSVEVLLVQCRDARAMQGHFPPICYPSSGCQIHTLGGVRQWTIRGGSTVPGLEYEVIRPDGRSFVVRDFFVLPNGKYATDMTTVMAAAKNYQELVFGGAQVQVLFDATVTSRERDAIFSDVMFPYVDLLEVLRSAQWKDTATGPAAPAASVAVTSGYPTGGTNGPD